MLEKYVGQYSDSFGHENVVIENDSKTLKMCIRGFEFESDWIEDWELTSRVEKVQTTALPLDLNAYSGHLYLKNFILDFAIPVLVVSPITTTEANLHVHFDIRLVGSFWLELQYESQYFRSEKHHLGSSQ